MSEVTLTREDVERISSRCSFCKGNADVCLNSSAHGAGERDCLLGLMRDLALQSLSQEAVLDEYARGLKYALDVVLDTDEQSECGDELIMIADAIREELALKREPNAEAQASGSSEHTMVSATPAPAAPAGEAYARDLLRKLRRWLLEINHGYPEVKAYPLNQETELGLFLEEVATYLERPAPAAPDLAEILSDWRVVAEFFESRNWPDTKLGDAASRLHARLPSLLAELGQGWMLEPRELKLLIDYHDAKGCEAEAMGVDGSVRYHDKRRKHYESLLPPGASDE